MENDLRESHPCYGEFQCSHCKRQWKSTNAWANYGQNCNNCDTLVRPKNLSKNYAYICDDCHILWYSRYSDRGLPCKNCGSAAAIRPRDLDDRRDREFIENYKRKYKDLLLPSNPNGAHIESLCEKCRSLGRPCRETDDDEKIRARNRISNVDDGSISRAFVSILFVVV